MLPSLSKCFCRITSYSNLPLGKCNVTPRQHNISNTVLRPSVVHLHTSSVNNSFWEPDRKGGYKTAVIDKRPALVQIRQGFKELKKEIGIWKNEVVEFMETDPLLVCRPGETDTVWVFDEQSKLKRWVTTTDNDHGEGFSKCTFELSKAGRGLFSGTLDTRVPKDGRIQRAGYAGIRSTRHQKSFKRDSYHDWSIYNTLVLKVRGDGRSYLINLSTEGYFDLLWNDIYSFILYTRGGPYWQIAKIPFSKFFLGSKGRIQDKQSRVPLDKISHFGLSVGDKINGPFSLEVEYIGLEFDPLHEEESAYEKYKTAKGILGV